MLTPTTRRFRNSFDRARIALAGIFALVILSGCEVTLAPGTTATLESETETEEATISIADGMAAAEAFDFGKVVPGDTATRPFVLDPGGGTVSGLVVSGIAAPFDFAGGTFPGTGGTCETEFSSRCTLVLTFSPADSGSKSGTMTLTYSDGESEKTATRLLRGQGFTPGELSFADGASYDFGSVALGSTAIRTLSIGHGGDESVTSVSTESLTRSYFSFNGGAYPGTGGDCGSTIGSDCTIRLSVTPRVLGTVTTPLRITYVSGGVSREIEIELEVTGTGDAANLSISASPSAFDFGSAFVGYDSDVSTFTVRNDGNVAASSIGESVSAPLAAPFAFAGGAYPGTGGTCGTRLASGASCTIKVYFSPPEPGAHAGTLALEYLNGSSTSYQTTTAALSGTGTSPATLVFEVETLDFGWLTYSDEFDMTVRIDNTGDVGASFLSESITSEPVEKFEIPGGYPGSAAGGTCGSSIPAGGSCLIGVRFHNFNYEENGTYTGTYSLNYFDGVGNVTATLRLQAEASIIP